MDLLLIEHEPGDSPDDDKDEIHEDHGIQRIYGFGIPSNLGISP